MAAGTDATASEGVVGADDDGCESEVVTCTTGAEAALAKASGVSTPWSKTEHRGGSLSS